MAAAATGNAILRQSVPSPRSTSDHPLPLRHRTSPATATISTSAPSNRKRQQQRTANCKTPASATRTCENVRLQCTLPTSMLSVHASVLSQVFAPIETVSIASTFATNAQQGSQMHCVTRGLADRADSATSFVSRQPADSS